MTAADLLPASFPGAVLLLALAIDWSLGEPPTALHPVVWMGRYLEVVGHRIALTPHTPARKNANTFWRGAIGWCAGAGAVALVAWMVDAGLRLLPWWAALPALGLALKPMLAWRMLHAEVAAVETALAESLDAGRARLSRLVSRDVTLLSAAEVRESAIETLAENLNDSVIAPLFWFVLFGLPGAAVYRFANTADAMWGYHGRWEWAGKWAAHADDVLSWLPARITAALLLALRPRLWPRLPAEARRTPSPNGGWPMGAMALRLGVRLSKPGVYCLNAGGRDPQPADTAQALKLARNGVLVGAVCGLLAIYSIALARMA